MIGFARSLIGRFLLSLSALLLVSLFALVIWERTFVIPSLLTAESRLAEKELDRIVLALEDNHDGLAAITRDWANWDDSYAFIQGQQANYTSSHFSAEMFEDINVQLMVFIDIQASIKWVAGLDPATGEYRTCSSLSDNCEWAGRFIRRFEAFNPQQGYRLIDTGTGKTPSLLSAEPILRTDRTGPSMGLIVMVRLIDERLVETLERQTGLAIDINTVATEAQRQNEPVTSRQETVLTAQKRIDPQRGTEALLITTDLPREQTNHYRSAFRYTMAWTVLLLLSVLLVVVSLLWIQVIRPLKQLTGFTRKTRRDTFWEQPAQFQAVPRALKTRRDEIGSLARNFQRLLAAQKTRTSNLVKLSHQDPLTGLANRRLYDEKLAQALSQSQLVSVLMLDIDHFKLYNDHFGHQMGDDCLVSLANQMKECFEQPGNVVARTGGEEFSILLPGQSVEDAVQDAERLRKLIKQLRIPHPNSPVASVVTVSVGVASTANVRGLGPEMLMRRADEALYQAKAEGRDRIKRYAASVIQSSD